ncbi:EAL domain-containing protein [Coleofasciculus sp. FACHB-64]|uniref:EAL domain-containing protein n=1 Tax=Cyanophyceae TaxID=3028117 RepID=UPI001682D68B|nr:MULTISPECIES: EAL domain-containing protein [unclassified Coleofasciculus]MBD1836713.1 EAL domain-containing protein [Coleofasciculus sp. FACHB-501]MBD2047973.1 EAL domain-containing protein [Coleofasciculus sp. FACHB-64]
MSKDSIKVLLIEDDEDDYILTRDLLSEIEREKFDLEWVDSYDAALEKIQMHQHDVYLVDYRLGAHNGLELLQEAISTNCKAPIILLTGQGDREVDFAAMKAGAADYLVKGKMDAPLLERAIRYSIERVKTLEALRESESRLENILGSLDDSVWSVSAITREPIYISPAAAEIYGRPVSQFFERPNLWLEVIHPDDRERIEAMTQALLQVGAADEEYRIFRPDGEERWIRNRAHLGRDANGNVIRIDGLAADITKRKQAEEALRSAMRENSQLAAAIANLTTGVTITDPTLPDNPIIFVNPAFTAITGYSATEVMGSNCRFLQGKDTDFTVVKVMREAIASKQPIMCVVLNYCKDGTPFWNELTINPVFDNDGKLINFIGLQNDITVRKQTEEAIERLRHQNELILNSAGEGIYGLDIHGNATFVNPAAARMLGWEVEELIGRPLHFICHHSKADGAPYPREACPIYAAFKDGTVQQIEEEVFWRKDGTSFPVEYISTPIRENGQLVGAVVTFQDITERVGAATKAAQTQEALRESQERYELAVSGANDGLWDWNLKTNEIYFSPRWKSMLGCEESEISNTPDAWFERVHPEDIEQLKGQISLHLEGLTPHFENEHRILHKDGTYRWMLIRGMAVRDTNGKASRMAGSQTDITERKQVEKQLLHDAFHDVLTGLPNRALFRDRLGQAIERSKRTSDYFFAVLFLDIDRFKVINDSLGHMIGDQLLVAIAQRLKACLRGGDTVARLGGDEFTILLDDVKNINNATDIAERIHLELMHPFSLNEQEVFTTASIGIAIGGGSQSAPAIGYDCPENLLRDADTAMYRAKSMGRARHEVFDTTMHTRAVALLQLENDLRRAIERDEFQLHYQPIVSLTTGRLDGFEALVRWQHPERGLISPAEFIPIAEETGLIVPIGLWVLYNACYQMYDWQQFYPELLLTISVNLSSKQFLQPDLVKQIAQILRETRLDARSLKLEITESAVMENAESAIKMLFQLKALGVHLHIDDFGTGYSSLSYLHRFPIDQLKIDRSFISRIGAKDDSLEIVRAIVTLAHTLELNVTAEGVETAEQLSQLREMECEYGQGYFFAKPLTQESAKELIVTTQQLTTDFNYFASIFAKPQ